MRQFLAVAILGATMAVTASSAFADERSGGVQDRVVQGSTTFAVQDAAQSHVTAGEFTLPKRMIADHERP